MRALVTGGAGFIGSHLIDALLDLGAEVFVIDDFSSGSEKFLNKKSVLEKVDIRDKEKVQKFFSFCKPDIVFHMAAQIDLRRSIENPEIDYEINVLGSKNIISSCLSCGVKKIIFSSSSAVYSGSVQLPCDEPSLLAPATQYGKSKLEIENYIKDIVSKSKIKATVLRYSNVYGPRQGAKGEGGVIAVFFKKAMSCEPLIIFGTGEQTRDFVFVKDVVQANLKAIESKADFRVYNISTSKETNILDLSYEILKISGKNCKIEHRDIVKGEVLRSCLENSLARNELGWKPEFSLEKGLFETFEYFKSF